MKNELYKILHWFTVATYTESSGNIAHLNFVCNRSEFKNTYNGNITTESIVEKLLGQSSNYITEDDFSKILVPSIFCNNVDLEQLRAIVTDFNEVVQFSLEGIPVTVSCDFTPTDASLNHVVWRICIEFNSFPLVDTKNRLVTDFMRLTFVIGDYGPLHQTIAHWLYEPQTSDLGIQILCNMNSVKKLPAYPQSFANNVNQVTLFINKVMQSVISQKNPFVLATPETITYLLAECGALSSLEDSYFYIYANAELEQQLNLVASFRDINVAYQYSAEYQANLFPLPIQKLRQRGKLSISSSYNYLLSLFLKKPGILFFAIDLDETLSLLDLADKCSTTNSGMGKLNLDNATNVDVVCKNDELDDNDIINLIKQTPSSVLFVCSDIEKANHVNLYSLALEIVNIRLAIMRNWPIVVTDDKRLNYWNNNTICLQSKYTKESIQHESAIDLSQIFEPKVFAKEKLGVKNSDLLFITFNDDTKKYVVDSFSLINYFEWQETEKLGQHYFDATLPITDH